MHYNDDDIYVEGVDDTRSIYLYCKSYIHTDDTIDIIKKKICGHKKNHLHLQKYIYLEYKTQQLES